MKKVIFTILSILLSFAATSQDIDFYVKQVVEDKDYTPEIHCIKPFGVELKIYRRYSNETEFQLIANKLFSSSNDPYVDESITICHDHDLDASDKNIYYYITDKDSTVFSEEKGGNFGDSNSPEWPELTYLDIHNNNLVLHWEPSKSKDIQYYELRKHNPINSSLQDGWDTIQPRQRYDRYIDTITIAENICDRISEYTFPYTIFATDFCDNDSKTGALDTTNNVLYPPILKSVEYDNCNTLEFKWSKNRSLRGEITSCQIQYKLFDTDSIKDIDIPLSDIDITGPDYQIYRLKVSEHPELSNKNPRFRIKTTARTTDEQYFSNKTCWSDPVTIIEIPVAPVFSIESVMTKPDNSENVLWLFINKSTNPISGRKYILTREYDNNPPEIIRSENDDDIPDKYRTSFHDKNISNINSSINYRLSVVYECNNNNTLLLGETCFNSIFLENIGNDTEIKLSWNSISAGSYDNITYNVVRTYNGEVHSEDVQNNTTYTDDLSFIEPNSFKTVKWQVKAINKGINNIDTIAVSNTITHEISGELQMPNAFIPDSEYEINRFFGPMNNFDENDIKKYRLLIFNNTGTLIWSTEEYSSSNMEISRWNGKDFNGQPCVRGTYIYEVYVELDKSDKPLTARGTVTLIRKN
ncbi:MAG: gliding motility-associated C-terminal domain-containing protein [Bacteroidales bacterium]|nr:gliding motility-associated C-terminal domain-containing protein [Bacteroidales bacterium]